MNRFGSLIALSAIITVLAAGCSGPDGGATVTQPGSPSPTASQASGPTPTPGSVNQEPVLQQFQLLAGKAKDAKEATAFVDANIGALDAQTADKLLLALEQFYDKHLPGLNANFSQMLAQPETAQKLNELGYPLDFSKIKNDDTLKNWLLNQTEGKLALDSIQGDFYLRVDYVALQDAYAKYASDETKAYLAIRATEDKKRFSSDAALKITRIELGERIIVAESYLTKFANGAHRAVVVAMYQAYMSNYVSNYRYDAIDETTMKLLPAVKSSYEQFVATNGSTKSGKLIQDYLAIINQNKDVIYHPGKKGESILGDPKSNVAEFWESLSTRIDKQFQTAK